MIKQIILSAALILLISGCGDNKKTEEIKTLKQKLEIKKSASIKIESKIIENDEICVEFVGYYVIKL